MHKSGAAAVTAALAASLVVTGCGGSSAPATDAAAPQVSASPDRAGATAAGATARHHPRADDRGGGAPSAAQPAPAGTGPADGGAASPGSAGTNPGGGGNGGTTTATARRAPLTPAGRYRYHVDGSASSALGNRTFDGTSILTVDPPAEHRQHSTQQGEEGSSEQTVLAAADGLYLLDIRISQQGFSEEFRPEGRALLLPSGGRAGDRWRWQMTSTDGDYTLRATLRLTDPSSSATVSGRRVATTVVTSDIVITGNGLSLTTHQRDEATRDGLIVHEHAVGDGTAYGTKIHTDTTRTLLAR